MAIPNTFIKLVTDGSIKLVRVIAVPNLKNKCMCANSTGNFTEDVFPGFSVGDYSDFVWEGD